MSNNCENIFSRYDNLFGTNLVKCEITQSLYVCLCIKLFSKDWNTIISSFVRVEHSGQTKFSKSEPGCEKTTIL